MPDLTDVLIYTATLAVGLLLSLGSMSLLGSVTASFLWRLIMSYALLAAVALYGVLASVALRLVGLGGMSQWATARAFKYAMRFVAGVRFEVVQGGERLNGTRPAVFVGNHQTALDVALLATVWPRWCSVTAKQQLKRMPFLGWFMALSGTVFIDRGNRQTAMRAFDGAAEEMRARRQSVWIFPEGTRSNARKPDDLLPFKKGAFHLAIRAGVPIVPVVCGVYAGVLNADEWRFRTGTIPVVVLPPIPTDDLTAADVDNLCLYTRNVMLKALITLTNTPRGQQAFLTHPPDLEAETQAAAVVLRERAQREKEARERGEEVVGEGGATAVAGDGKADGTAVEAVEVDGVDGVAAAPVATNGVAGSASGVEGTSELANGVAGEGLKKREVASGQ